MRFLVDANLSPVVALTLRTAGHDALHVADVGLLHASDEEILRHAASGHSVIFSADADFGALLALGGLSRPSVVLLRSADHLNPAEQANLVLRNLDAIADDLATGAVVTFARGHLRVRSLPIKE